MNKATNNNDMRTEYDFSGGIRGKHHQDWQEQAHLVALDPDVAEVFNSSEAVNHALRLLMQVAKEEVSKNPHKSR